MAYADNQQGEPLAPSWFPNPWQGSPNIKFLGSPDPRAASCGGGVDPHLCYSAGAIRLDNPTANDVTITSLVVDVHSSVTGGKKFTNLWSDAVSPAHTFTVPHGQSVILTEDQPPGQTLTYDNFDSSDTPDRGCSPIPQPPTLTFTIQGDPTTYTLTDTNHVIDTGEIINTVFGSVDSGWCPSDANSPRNESIQWQEVGATLPALPRSTCKNEEALRPRPCKSASLTLSPPPSNPPPGSSVLETATLLGPDGLGLANASVTFGVLAGPSANQPPVTKTTDGNGQWTFNLTETGNSSNGDLVAASAGVTGSFQSDPVCVAWGSGSCPPPPPPPPPPGCPASWSCADIGNPSPAGSQTYDSGTGTWTIEAGGSDIFGAADHFHYVWQSLSGDGGISARIESQTNTYSMAKAGVMLRADNSPGSAEFSALVAPSNLVFMEYRTTAGGTTTRAGTVSGSPPKYLQVSRTGSSFTASWSDNGSAWTQLGSINIPAMSGTILQGLAATSHNTSALSTVVFDSVSLSGGTPPPTNDFSISANPSTVTVAPGSSGMTTINTATTSGASQSVALSASGLPGGATASFVPPSVTSGGSSTMTIATATTTSTGSYTVTVTGTGTSATHSTPVTLVVQSSPPPPPGCPTPPWTCADIGTPTPAGSETYDSGTGKWTISAGGSDIFSSADHFRFDYQSPVGTNTVEAQITGQTNSNAWAKAGVMMRLDTTPGSPQFSVLITPGNGIFVEYRTTAGGTTTRAGTVAGVLPPKYIWVVRSGTTFTGYYNTTNDMVTWTKLFSQTIPSMSGTVLEGLAATSHNSSALCTVMMDTVTVS